MKTPTLSRRENLQGHLAQLISTSCHVSGFVLYKDVIATIPATQVAATQLALGALILWVMALATNRPLKLQGPVWRVLALGVLAPAWIMLFMAFGTARTTATNATIMWGLVPLLVPILGAIILREHLRIAVVLGAILGFSGTLLIVSHRTGGGSGDIYGDILVFCAIMCACATQLSGRRVNQYFSDWLMVTCYQVTVSALVAFVVMLIMDPPDPFLANADWKAALKLFYLGAFAVVVNFATFNYALRRLPVARTSLYVSIFPALGTVLSVLYIGETIGWTEVFGVLIVISGVILPAVVPAGYFRRLLGLKTVAIEAAPAPAAPPASTQPASVAAPVAAVVAPAPAPPPRRAPAVAKVARPSPPPATSPPPRPAPLASGNGAHAPTVPELTERLMRPLLADWLNANLTHVIEREVGAALPARGAPAKQQNEGKTP